MTFLNPNTAAIKDISIVWFKRDLRLADHAPLRAAIDAGKPILLLYCFEPTLRKDPHYSRRHFRFLEESLLDLNERLAVFSTKVVCLREEVLPVL